MISEVLLGAMRPAVRSAVAAFSYIYIVRTLQKRRRRKYQKGRFWVKSLYLTRDQVIEELFANLTFDESVKNFTRMSLEDFINLCGLLKPIITKKDIFIVVVVGRCVPQTRVLSISLNEFYA